jgi:hypothetical protein
VLSLYAGSETQGVGAVAPLYRALLHGDAWARSDARGIHLLRPCVALVWPAPLAGRFLEWCGDGRHYERDADDGAISRYLEETGEPLLVSVPSLVEHDAAPTVASGGSFPSWLKRVAAVPIGEASALDVAWTRGAS